MAQLFEHTFQEALFGVGALLALLGGILSIANGGAALSGGLMDAVSGGFAAFFLALFAGSLAGVGLAMMADALILGLRGSRMHMAVAACFSILSLLAAASSMARVEETSFPMFVLFFASLSAAGAFMLSAVVFGFSALFHSFIAKAQEREGRKASRSRSLSGHGG